MPGQGRAGAVLTLDLCGFWMCFCKSCGSKTSEVQWRGQRHLQGTTEGSTPVVRTMRGGKEASILSNNKQARLLDGCAPSVFLRLADVADVADVVNATDVADIVNVANVTDVADVANLANVANVAGFANVADMANVA